MEDFAGDVDLYGMLSFSVVDFLRAKIYVEILKIRRGASKVEIKKAYHKVCRVFFSTLSFLAECSRPRFRVIRIKLLRKNVQLRKSSSKL